jgi:uncharacterized protein YggE
MKTKLNLLVALFLLGLSIEGLAQSLGNYLYNNDVSASTDRINIPININNGSSLQLKAEVMMNVVATSYTVIFAVTQQGKDVNQVDSLMNSRVDFVRFGLEKIGIPVEDIHVDAVSMVPTFTTQIEEKKFSKKITEIPIGFEMKKNIHVLFKKHRMLDEILSVMAYADIYDMVKVEYNIDGLNKYYQQLKEGAQSVITSKEDTYKNFQMHLKIQGIADGITCTYPFERYKNYTAVNSGSNIYVVEDAKKMLNNVTVNGGINKFQFDMSKESLKQQFVTQSTEKNKTIFYDRMPYNQFDLIINPDVAEPCIQLYYSLNITYSLMNEEQYQQQQKLLEAQKNPVAQILTKKEQRRIAKGRAPRVRKV